MRPPEIMGLIVAGLLLLAAGWELTSSIAAEDSIGGKNYSCGSVMSPLNPDGEGFGVAERVLDRVSGKITCDRARDHRRDLAYTFGIIGLVVGGLCIFVTSVSNRDAGAGTSGVPSGPPPGPPGPPAAG